MRRSLRGVDERGKGTTSFNYWHVKAGKSAEVMDVDGAGRKGCEDEGGESIVSCYNKAAEARSLLG